MMDIKELQNKSFNFDSDFFAVVDGTDTKQSFHNCLLKTTT